MNESFQLKAIGASLLVYLVDPDSELPIDLSSATTKNFILQKPDATEITVASSFLTNGKDGALQYLTVLNDLDQVGQWSIQADLNVPGINYQGRASIGQFSVDDNL